MDSKFSKAQQEAKEYVEKYNLEKLIGDMLNALVYAKDPSPNVFIIKYLANITNSDELKQNSIFIGDPPAPHHETIKEEKPVHEVKDSLEDKSPDLPKKLETHVPAPVILPRIGMPHSEEPKAETLKSSGHDALKPQDQKLDKPEPEKTEKTEKTHHDHKDEKKHEDSHAEKAKQDLGEKALEKEVEKHDKLEASVAKVEDKPVIAEVKHEVVESGHEKVEVKYQDEGTGDKHEKVEEPHHAVVVEEIGKSDHIAPEAHVPSQEHHEKQESHPVVHDDPKPAVPIEESKGAPDSVPQPEPTSDSHPVVEKKDLASEHHETTEVQSEIHPSPPQPSEPVAGINETNSS